ncbi:MAG: hypothetical protein IPM08_14390 [Actinomycetales bacterium]|nr:hypothetical protein [Actinomycetales bacterium]
MTAPPDLDIVGIRRVWPEVLGRIFTRRRVTWTFVSQHASVLDYDGRRLVLGIATVGLTNTFRAGNHAEVVRQALIDEIGLDVIVEGVAAPRDQPAAAPLEPSQITSPTAQPEPGTPAQSATPQSATRTRDTRTRDTRTGGTRSGDTRSGNTHAGCPPFSDAHISPTSADRRPAGGSCTGRIHAPCVDTAPGADVQTARVTPSRPRRARGARPRQGRHPTLAGGAPPPWGTAYRS